MFGTLILLHIGIYYIKYILNFLGLPSKGFECWQQMTRHLKRHI